MTNSRGETEESAWVASPARYAGETAVGAAPPVLARTYRGSWVESEHRGHVCVVDAQGRLQLHAGEPSLRVFARSAAKPFQALPLIEDGVRARFGLREQELALACASHNGEPFHVAAARAFMTRIEVREEDLQCGVHRPLGVDLGCVEPRARYDVLQNNCSGKHIGMLAACRAHGWPLDSYLSSDHPHQQRILKTLSGYGSIPVEDIAVQLDGCSAPAFNVPLETLALMYAGLLSDDPAARSCFSLMSRHPDMIAGTNRFDSVLMKTLPDRVVSKVGAEGVQCLALRGSGLGIAIKISDGAGRAAPAVALALLRSLGEITERELRGLSAFVAPEIRNHRGLLVGRIECVYSF